MMTCEDHVDVVLVFEGKHASDCPLCVAEGEIEELNGEIGELKDELAESKES